MVMTARSMVIYDHRCQVPMIVSGQCSGLLCWYHSQQISRWYSRQKMAKQQIYSTNYTTYKQATATYSAGAPVQVNLSTDGDDTWLKTRELRGTYCTQRATQNASGGDLPRGSGRQRAFGVTYRYLQRTGVRCEMRRVDDTRTYS